MEMDHKTMARVGVIGCGFYAQNHLNAWSDLRSQRAELVAVCDLDPEKAQAAGEKFKAAWYTDVDEMLDAHTIDLLDITTQMSSHRALAAKAAERKIASILQKPLAPNLDECIAIVESAEQHGVWLAVHENFRFATPMRRVKSVLSSGAIGQPNWARISFRTGFDIYAGQPYLADEKRLAILDSGIHVLDLARFFLGEVDRVSCETQKRNSMIKGEDTATIMLRHKSGSVSVVEVTYEAHRQPDVFPETLLEIEGSEGSVVLSAGQQMTVTTKGQSFSENVGSPLFSWTSHPWHVSQEAVLHANAHFLEAFRQGKEAETSGRYNLKTFALVEAAYQAAELHACVRPLVS
jgi:predicted dehydrogenase